MIAVQNAVAIAWAVMWQLYLAAAGLLELVDEQMPFDWTSTHAMCQLKDRSGPRPCAMGSLHMQLASSTAACVLMTVLHCYSSVTC